ncbi:hypothetical protein Ahy_B07g086580 [Arachis hypogaea]|uniref:Uncharacterized protein n=1 Tax=Arachis hypogaea TaxID=3818 RepID=A0A444YA70_ARAHY|nr:hypothetical protein Ahy_B07g086580 [Arachis hypogaea]
MWPQLHTERTAQFRRPVVVVPPASSSLRSFRPPCSEPLPAPQACTHDVQNSETDAEDLDPEADEVDSFEQYVVNLFATSNAQKHKGRKTTEFWDVKTIESDGTIKQVKLSVKEAMKPPNGRRIVLRFHSALQLVGHEAGLLSGVMGLLGSDYTKFPICKKDWRKVRTRDKVYNECVKEGLGRKRRTDYTFTAMTLNFYLKKILKIAQMELLRTIGDGEVQENAKNRSKQLYTHTGRSKSLARLREEEERIEAIEQRDESSRLLSQNDLLAQALAKEHPGRVRGMGLGPTSSQVFGMNFHQPSNGFEREEIQRVLLELQAELAAEKLKRKAVEDEVAAEKTKRQEVEDEVAAENTKRQAMEDEVAAGKVRMQAMESTSICLLQGQGRKLPSDVAP